MKKEVGLWISHRRAILVINLDQEEEIKRIASKLEKRVRYSGASHSSDPNEPHNDASEDGRDQRYNTQLGHYYDRVISYLRDATSILILGPGMAKVELKKRLKLQGLGEHIVAVKAADKMTDDQIVAEVRQHFREPQTGFIQPPPLPSTANQM